MSNFIKLKTYEGHTIHTPVDNILFIKEGRQTIVVFKEPCEGVKKEQKMITPVKSILEDIKAINNK